MILRKNKKRKFQKNQLSESLEPLKNPGRGWYHIYTYDLAQELPELYIVCEEETIALLLIDIGAFQNERIPEEALAYLEKILRYFKEKEKKLILRPVYDTKGHGMEKEPGTIQLIKTHMYQLGTVMEKYAENILVVQGILVGDWGEMHGSRYLSDGKMTELVKTYITAMHGRCYIAVRTLGQWRVITQDSDEKVKNHLLLFNDGIFGSPTDLGTYEDSERRKKILEWQEQYFRYGPIGGEVVAAQTPFTEKDKEHVIQDLKKMHVTYLNSTHDQRLLDEWKAQTVRCQESQISLYDYIGLHLGYRFITRDALWKKAKFLEINVENTGFADLYEEAECLLELRGAYSEYIPLEEDARTWKSGTKTRIRILAPIIQNSIDNLSQNNYKGGIEVYLHLRSKRNHKSIQFANTDAKDGILLGTFS